MLAQLGATLPLRRTSVPSRTQRRLQELQTFRDGLMRQRTAALNRRAHLRDPLLKRQNQTQINLFERQVKAIDRKMQQLIAADPQRARKVEILTSIPGIAATTAAGLLAEMPELGTLSGKAVASLAGMAAVPCESAPDSRRRRFIRRGRRLQELQTFRDCFTCRQRHAPRSTAALAELNRDPLLRARQNQAQIAVRRQDAQAHRPAPTSNWSSRIRS